MSDPDQGGGGVWMLLTGHGHVLVEIARNPDTRIRDFSPVVGLTERSVQAIVTDLEAAARSSTCSPPGPRSHPNRAATETGGWRPEFIAKVRDVVGLYMSPPEHALVLAVDEKSQIQALDRTAPCLPARSCRRGASLLRHVRVVALHTLT